MYFLSSKSPATMDSIAAMGFLTCGSELIILNDRIQVMAWLQGTADPDSPFRKLSALTFDRFFRSVLSGYLMTVTAFDHAAIPTAKPDEMLRFYRALGFSAPTPDDWRAQNVSHFSIQFGENKINVHAPALWRDTSFTLRGSASQPGCGDFCFVWSGSVSDLQIALQRAGALIEEGPVQRMGARSGGRTLGTSIYTRDPDRNLLEFIVYEPTK